MCDEDEKKSIFGKKKKISCAIGYKRCSETVDENA